MPVLGISPFRILCDLPGYDFQGYPLGDLQATRDRCRFDPATCNEKLDLGRAAGFRVNANDDAYSAKSGRPVAGFFPLTPHGALIFDAFSSFASAGGVPLILYNRKFKTNFRNGYKYG